MTVGSLNAEHMNKPEAAPRFAAARAAVACTPLTGKSAGVAASSSATAMLICIRSASCAFENVLELTADRLCWRKALVRAQIVLLCVINVLHDASVDAARHWFTAQFFCMCSRMGIVLTTPFLR